MRTSLERSLATLLVGMLKRLGYGFGSVCRAKGSVNQELIADLLRWLEEAGLTGLIRLRTDSEPAICVVAAKIERLFDQA